MSPEIPRGRFVWYELMTGDPDAAQTFYTKLTGWKAQAWDGAPTPYTMWMNGDTPVGGLMQLPDEVQQQGAPPHWIAYAATPDVDATTARATEAGGRLLYGPTDIPTVGRVATLADRQGAVWLLGWVKTDAMDMGPAGLYQMFGRSKERSMGGIFKKPPEMPGPSAWLVYVRVDSVDERVDVVKTLGGQVLNGPMDVPGGDRVAQCLDPQGAAFAIHSTAVAA